jgi:hypothetical protein
MDVWYLKITAVEDAEDLLREKLVFCRHLPVSFIRKHFTERNWKAVLESFSFPFFNSVTKPYHQCQCKEIIISKLCNKRHLRKYKMTSEFVHVVGTNTTTEVAGWCDSNLIVVKHDWETVPLMLWAV